MRTVTFETLPTVVAEMDHKLDLLIAQQTDRKDQVNPDKLYSVDELRDRLPDHPAKQTVYGWVNARTIPFEKYGRKLMFREQSISDWLSRGRRTSSCYIRAGNHQEGLQ